MTAPAWMRKRLNYRGANKYPPNTIGVEIEVEGTNIPKAIFQNWILHDDGSLRGTDNAEYVLREPMSRGKVEAALDYLEGQFRDAGTRLDRDSDRTSVHIHLNVQDRTWAEIMTFWTLWTIVEDLSYELCGPERRGNLFCLRVKDCEGLITSARINIESGSHPFQSQDYRYAGCNLTSIFKFGSLEFRGMHGTVDKTEILTWIDFLMLCLNASLVFDNPQEVVSKFSVVGVDNFLEEVLRLTPGMIRILKANGDWRGMLWEGMRLAQDIAWIVNDWGKKGQDQNQYQYQNQKDLGVKPDDVVIDRFQVDEPEVTHRPTQFDGIEENDRDTLRMIETEEDIIRIRDLERQQQDMSRQTTIRREEVIRDLNNRINTLQREPVLTPAPQIPRPVRRRRRGG